MLPVSLPLISHGNIYFVSEPGYESFWFFSSYILAIITLCVEEKEWIKYDLAVPT